MLLCSIIETCFILERASVFLYSPVTVLSSSTVALPQSESCCAVQEKTQQLEGKEQELKDAHKKFSTMQMNMRKEAINLQISLTESHNEDKARACALASALVAACSTRGGAAVTVCKPMFGSELATKCTHAS